MACGRKTFHRVLILQNMKENHVELMGCLGPPTYPVVGNMLDMPTKNFHTELQKFAYKCMLCTESNYRINAESCYMKMDRSWV